MTVAVELDDAGSHIIIHAEWRFRELCKSIPGVSWSSKENLWRMPLSWSGCLALRSTFKDDLEIRPSLRDWAIHELETRITPAMALREVTNLEIGDSDLFPHQRAGVEFLATARRALLADEPGLGKTAQAIRTLTELTRRGENVFPAMVVCPNSLKMNWQREFEKWWPGIRVQVVRGTAAQRRKQFDSYSKAYLGCPVHDPNAKLTATRKPATTRKGSAGVATSKVSASGTPTTPSVSERIAETGLPTNGASQTSESTSSPNSGSLSKSTTHTSLENLTAPSAGVSPQSSITTTQPEQSEVYSADLATTQSTKQNGTSSGLTEHECTCDPRPHVLVVNWESLRSHSRLAPYGSIALAKCEEHGGVDPKVTPAKCEVHERELNQIDFKAVIADEIHRSKDPKSKQSRALWAATGDADIRLALTGTPLSENVLDLWAILHWLNPDEWPSKTRWIDRMVDTMQNAFGGLLVLGVKPTMEAEFFSALQPRMRRMLKAVVLPWLPPVINERKDIEMHPKQKKAYEQMRDHMIAELEDGSHVTAPSTLTQTTRLIGFANSFATFETDPSTGVSRVVLAEPSNKVDALMEDIRNGEFGQDSVAVSAVSKQLINLLSARLKKEGIEHGLVTGDVEDWERQRAVDDFQTGRTKWILFTAQAGGVGITLTAARWLVRLQRPWSLVDDKQVNDRVHRIGSEIHDSVIILDYVSENTVEDRVREVLDVKGESFENIVMDQKQLLALLKEDKGKK